MAKKRNVSDRDDIDEPDADFGGSSDQFLTKQFDATRKGRRKRNEGRSNRKIDPKRIKNGGRRERRKWD